ncbi:MAG: hypothetical protein JSU82_14235 [Rhodospirillales bacterium]|nr:MAG: hypothetical protein JSU82_14235 [Rhodospirillales bacterium]
MRQTQGSNGLFFYGGVFCVTGATLMLQLIQTRILSVVAWYHLAFFVISTAMFGLTAGAVWVYLRGDRFTERTLSYDLAHYSGVFALSTALALAFQMTLAPGIQPSVTTLVTWTELAVSLAVPFFFSGVVVSLALTRSPYPVGRVYGVDLVGAAVGCLGVLALLNAVNGPSAILWTAVIAAVGSILFSHAGAAAEPAALPRLARVVKGRRVWVTILVAMAALNSLDKSHRGLYPVFAKDELQLVEPPWYETWNSFSRVIASRPQFDEPQMWGPSPAFFAADWRIPQSRLNIDGDAGTAAYGIEGDLSRAQFLQYDITNLAYHLPRLRRAAIIGVGGGRDVLSARFFGVEEIVGVEINRAFVDLLLHDPRFSRFVGVNRLDGVTLHIDEARSWFARSEQRFDLIQMSLIDTWAATGAGAFTLSENGLYTVEAWRIFLRRLAPDGVFTVSRWYSPQHVTETGRMVSLAVAALAESGVDNPADHVYLAATGKVATLIVSRSPFSADALARLSAATGMLRFDQLLAPGEQPASELLGRIVNARTRSALVALTRDLPLDLTPPTDERPFFFNQLPLHNVFKFAAVAASVRPHGVTAGNLFATGTLMMLFFISLALVVTAIIVPLRPALRDVGLRLASGGTAYFMLIGTGFMLVEIALLQRFSVFLGHPVYSLSIVLFSLIISTGAGSLLSDHLAIEQRTRFTPWVLATSGYIFSQLFWLPPVLLALDSAPLSVRALASVVIIFPAGLLMGFAFPAGMRIIAAYSRKPTPWFWGINGASGVLASIFAVGCSIAFGIGSTMALGALCYLLLVPAARVIGFPASTPARPAASLPPAPEDVPVAG